MVVHLITPHWLDRALPTALSPDHFQLSWEKRESPVRNGTSHPNHAFEIIASGFLTRLLTSLFMLNLNSSNWKTQINDKITAGKPRNKSHYHPLHAQLSQFLVGSKWNVTHMLSCTRFSCFSFKHWKEAASEWPGDEATCNTARYLLISTINPIELNRLRGKWDWEGTEY